MRLNFSRDLQGLDRRFRIGAAKGAPGVGARWER